MKLARNSIFNSCSSQFKVVTACFHFDHEIQSGCKHKPFQLFDALGAFIIFLAE